MKKNFDNILKFLIQNKYFSLIVLIILPPVFFYKLISHPTDVLYPAGDILTAYSLWKNFYVQNILNYHVMPLWNPYEFSGVPFIANASSGIVFPLGMLFFIFPVDLTFGYAFILDFILLGLFTFLFTRSLNIGKTGALAAGVIITFSGTVVSRVLAGHLFILDTFIWLPLLLYFLERGVQKKALIYGLYAAFPMGFMFLAGNSQIALYAVFFSFLYLCLRMLFSSSKKEHFKYYLIPFLLASVFGVFLSFIQTLPVLEFSKISSRGGGVDYVFASSFSLPPKQMLSFIFPFFFGSPIDNSFWGKGNFWELCGYIGTIPLVFAGFSLLAIKNNYVKIFLILGLFSALFALGSYSFIFPLFYKFIPLFNLFRAPARFLFFYAFSFAVLAGIGIDFVINNRKVFVGKLIKKISIFVFLFSSILTTLFLILWFVNFENFFEKYVLRYSYGINLNHKLLYDYAIFSLLIFSIFLLFSSVILYLSQNKKRREIVSFLILVTVLFELLILNSQFVAIKPVGDYYKIPSEIKYIQKDKSVFRIYDWDTSSFYLAEREGIENITGYNPTYISYYRDFVWNIGPHSNDRSDSYFQITKLKNYNILKFLNVKYVLSKNEIKNINLKLVFKNDFYVYELLKTLPRAYLTNINSKENKSYDLPVNLTAVNRKRINVNEIKLNLNLNEANKLVLSEIWYPGWITYDNNKEVPINKFYIFQSINLEKGKHDIRFIYKPISFEIGKWISVFSLLLLVSLIVINKKIFRR